VCLANNAFFSEINTYEKQQITITNTFLGAKNILNFLQAIKKQIHLVSHYNKHNYSKLVAKVHTVFASFAHTHIRHLTALAGCRQKVLFINEVFFIAIDCIRMHIIA
jgi:hypothetical protein